MEIDAEKMYLRTFKKRGDEEEYRVLDLKGKELKTVWLKQTQPMGLKDMLMGVQKQVISNGNVYYLKENEATESWELQIESLGS